MDHHNLQDVARTQQVLTGGSVRTRMAQALANKGSKRDDAITKNAIAEQVAKLKADPDGHHAAVAEQTAIARKRAAFLESHRVDAKEMTAADTAAVELARQAAGGVPAAEAVARHMVLTGPAPEPPKLPDWSGMNPFQKMKAALDFKARGGVA